MLDIGPSSSDHPLYVKRAEVMALGLAIRAPYEASPATRVHMVLDVDLEGDRRVMLLETQAREFVAAPLMRIGEECLVTASSFSGDRVYAKKFAPAWTNLRQDTHNVSESDGSPDLSSKAKILQKVETVRFGSAGYQVSAVHFRVELLDFDNQVAYFEVRHDEMPNAALLSEGQVADLVFRDYYGEPGRLNVQAFNFDWVTFRKEQLKARQSR